MKLLLSLFLFLLVSFGGKAQTTPPITHSWEFTGSVASNKVEDWTIVNFTNASTANGILHLTTASTNNHLRYNVPSGVTINPATSKTVIIRLKNETAETEARFYWWGSAATAAYIEFDISHFDTEYKEYKIDLSKQPNWTGTISIIRFDLTTRLQSWSYGQKMSVDYIKLSSEVMPAPEPPILSPMPSRYPAPFGVNLAGADFGQNISGVYGTDYGYPNAAELDYFKAKGLNLVRFTFKWERIQPDLNGPLNQIELARMKKFIDAARVRNIWILLDMHNYNRRYVNGEYLIIGSNGLGIEHVTDAWAKLVQEFKDYDNIWGYGLMNEPYNMLPSTPWFNIAQALITKIRTIDTEPPIVVGGDSYSSAARWLTASDNLKNLVDPSNNLIFEAHQYIDKDASGSYKLNYDQEGATPNTGVERLTPFVNWLKANNLRGFVGEYGVPDDDPRWLVALDNMMKYMADNCVNGTYWAAGPRWGTYKLAVEPRNWEDRPQMAILEKYKTTGAHCYSPNSAKEEKLKHNWHLFPNPATENVLITLDKIYPEGLVLVKDTHGRTVLEKKVKNTTSISLSLTGLPAGLYLVQITAGPDTTVVKVVKE